jgi:hypothetical protein
MACQERDRMILAFALAVNERNIASSDLETAADDAERRELQNSVRSATSQSEQLRAKVMQHFAQHGC